MELPEVHGIGDVPLVLQNSGSITEVEQKKSAEGRLSPLGIQNAANDIPR